MMMVNSISSMQPSKLFRHPPIVWHYTRNVASSGVQKSSWTCSIRHGNRRSCASHDSGWDKMAPATNHCYPSTPRIIVACHANHTYSLSPLRYVPLLPFSKTVDQMRHPVAGEIQRYSCFYEREPVGLCGIQTHLDTSCASQ